MLLQRRRLILSTTKTTEDKEDNFLKLSFYSFLFVFIVMIFWRDCIPYSLFEVWYMGKGSTWQGVFASWPIYLWGGGLTLFSSAVTTNERKVNREAEDIIANGTIISVFAGIVEEICFRWWFFYGQILGFKIISFITCGFVQWLFRSEERRVGKECRL